jgi:hypothetical protein
MLATQQQHQQPQEGTEGRVTSARCRAPSCLRGGRLLPPCQVSACLSLFLGLSLGLAVGSPPQPLARWLPHQPGAPSTGGPGRLRLLPPCRKQRLQRSGAQAGPGAGESQSWAP